ITYRSVCRKVVACCMLVAFSVQTSWSASAQISVPRDSAAVHPVRLLPGQSLTLLPDGRWLFLGGKNTSGLSAAAVLQDSRTGSMSTLPSGLLTARAWHSATVLPDGNVLVFGGVGKGGNIIGSAEIFDPSSETFRAASARLSPRAHHTATVLTDGRLFVAGGISVQGQLALD